MPPSCSPSTVLPSRFPASVVVVLVSETSYRRRRADQQINMLQDFVFFPFGLGTEQVLMYVFLFFFCVVCLVFFLKACCDKNV